MFGHKRHPTQTHMQYIVPFILFIGSVSLLGILTGFLWSVSFVMLRVNQDQWFTVLVIFKPWHILRIKSASTLLMSTYREHRQTHFYCFFFLLGKHHSSLSSPGQNPFIFKLMPRSTPCKVSDVKMRDRIPNCDVWHRDKTSEVLYIDIPAWISLINKTLETPLLCLELVKRGPDHVNWSWTLYLELPSPETRSTSRSSASPSLRHTSARSCSRTHTRQKQRWEMLQITEMSLFGCLQMQTSLVRPVGCLLIVLWPLK